MMLILAACVIALLTTDPLHLPTQVLPLPDGRIAVLDGSNNRIAFFDDSLAFRSAVPCGEGQAMGFCLGPDDTLLVADTGKGRIVVLDQQGVVMKTIPVEGKPTGVAFAVDRVYVTDHLNHAVHVFALPEYRPLARYPLEADPYPAYPCSPRWHYGALYLVEPLNGRIRKMRADGTTERFIGTYGVRKGCLYSPKDLAVDVRGRLFVTDSFLGAVTVFSREGTPVGLKEGFHTPYGLAFDGQGRLLVVEMEKGSLTVATQGTGTAAPLEEVEMEKRICTACHPEWLPGWGSLETHPAGRPGLCLRCHDGSVVDSRNRAWAGHSHLFHSREEETCMTCHQAHGEGEGFFEMDSAVFLRFPGLEGGACRTCHKITGHFMGPLSEPVPQSLVRLGAPPSSSMDCRTCHLPHGDGQRFLLLGRDQEPCITCHDATSHPGVGHLSSFTCLDCHLLHGEGGLKARPGDRDCLDCHHEKETIRGTKHQVGSEGCTLCHDVFETSGRCGKCHDEVGATHHAGESIPLDGQAHEVGCATCHDPHIPDQAFLRRGTAKRFCAACHGPMGLWLYLHSHTGK